jgi:TolB protein
MSKRDGNPEIYVMNADGSEQRRLTRSTTRDRAPVWSPDGRRIAFVRSRFNAYEDIYVMNADGSGQRRLIRNGVGPHWSPDGRMIAFTRSTAVNPPDGGRFQRDVWVVNADGSGARNLSQNPHGDNWLVSWSPAP